MTFFGWTKTCMVERCPSFSLSVWTQASSDVLNHQFEDILPAMLKLAVCWMQPLELRKENYSMGISACNPKKPPWLKGNSFSKLIIFRLQPLVFGSVLYFSMIPSKFYFLTIILGREPPKFLTWFYFGSRPRMIAGPIWPQAILGGLVQSILKEWFIPTAHWV